MTKFEGRRESGRRDFLRKTLGATAALTAGAGGLASATAGGGEEGSKAAVAPAAPIPTVRLGKFTVTRLISGGNPIGGYAHSTPAMARVMREHFTRERTAEYLLKLEAEGINTWQFDYFDYVLEAQRLAKEKGSRLQFICLHHDGRGDLDKVVAEQDPIGIVHHGQVTDRAFREGKREQVRDFVKRVRDRGRLAGVSTHNPDNLKRMADEGWENDFFMVSFYQVTRTREEQIARFGTAAVREPFFESDPAEITPVIRKIEKPCLCFKILAAGRRCFRPEDVEEAFRHAFASIKKTDALIVGMFPKFHDEVRENADLARRYGGV